jgi:hypothetical protein
MYQPASPYVAGITMGDMSALAGQSAAGLWQLTVQDMAPTGACCRRCVPAAVQSLTACLQTRRRLLR